MAEEDQVKSLQDLETFDPSEQEVDKTLIDQIASLANVIGESVWETLKDWPLPTEAWQDIRQYLIDRDHDVPDVVEREARAIGGDPTSGSGRDMDPALRGRIRAHGPGVRPDSDDDGGGDTESRGGGRRGISRGGFQVLDEGGSGQRGGLDSLSEVETGDEVEEPRANHPSSGGGGPGDAPPGADELAEDPPIGVEPDEEVGRRDKVGQHPTKPRVRGTTEAGNVADKLYTQSDLTAPRGWDTQRVADLQRDLVSSGLVEGVGELGMWKPSHEQAYRAVLGMANRQGKSVDEILSGLKSDRQGQLQKEKDMILEDNEFVAPEFSVDDESLKNAVEKEFERRGGRSPTEAELERFASKLLADQKAVHETEVDKARTEWEHGMKQEFDNLFETERKLGLEYDNPFSDAKHPNEVEANAPDPEARLERELRTYLEPEREFEEDRQARQQRGRGLIGSVRSLNQAIGRM